MEPNVEKMYFFIMENAPLGIDRIGAFVAGNTECEGALDKLIQNGYVTEKDGLYALTPKIYEE